MIMMNISTEGKRHGSAEGGGINWHMFVKDGESKCRRAASEFGTGSWWPVRGEA
jgi:hypothetical protein